MKTIVRRKLFPLFLLFLAQVAWGQKGLDTFYNAIPIPPAIKGPDFKINMKQSLHSFSPGQKDTTGIGLDSGVVNYSRPIKTYCYNDSGSNAMSYLGPTLIWDKKDDLTFKIYNNLPDNETTLHWHGINLPSDMDGGPHEIIFKGTPWKPEFKVIDPVQTAWYHSHLMDSTTEQVVLGLAGMIILEDPANDQLRAQLPHDYSKNDFPIVLQEKAFVYDTLNNKVSAKNIFLGKNGNGKVGQGPLTLVNGVLNGYLNVPKQMVRLRLLNGSPVRVLYIGFSSTLGDTISQSLIPAYLIATDGGYTSSPHSMKKIMIAPGERMEVLLDFTNMPNNSQLYMNNLGSQLPGDIIGGSSDPNKGFMKFIVVDTIKPQDSIVIKPTTLLSYSVDTSGTFKKRVKNLTNVTGTPGNGQGGPWTIDSTGFEMEIANDTILVDSKEMWTINNKTGVSHPFHIHKVQFQVVNYYGKIGADSDSAYYSSIDTITPGVRRLPSFLMGYKDDVLIRSGASLTFVTTFSNYGDTSIDPMMNGFMYHCHILTHEDDEMMHQFVVVNNSAYHGWPQSVKKIGTLKANLFPNPAGTVLNVNGNLQGLTHVRITDVLGRILRELEISLVNNQASIDVEDLPRGVVFVELTSGRERLVQKIFLK